MREDILKMYNKMEDNEILKLVMINGKRNTVSKKDTNLISGESDDTIIVSDKNTRGIINTSHVIDVEVIRNKKL